MDGQVIGQGGGEMELELAAVVGEYGFNSEVPRHCERRLRLGHTKPTLTDRYYRRSDPLAASQKLAGVIATLRATAATAMVRRMVHLRHRRRSSGERKSSLSYRVQQTRGWQYVAS